MSKNSPHHLRFWRWLALLSILGNAIYSMASERIPSLVPTIAEVSAKYPALFTPAPYAFAIWGAIYLSLIGYAIFALLPSQRNVGWHDSMTPGLIAYSVLGVSWTVLFRHQYLAASVGVIAAMFLVGSWMFGLAKRAVWEDVAHPLASVPFALYFGWISVAAIANTMAWAVASGVFDWSASQVGWTLIAIVAATTVAVLVSRRYSDTTYPAVVAWALAAIFAAQREITPLVANTALLGALIAAVFAVKNSLWLRHHPFNRNFEDDPHFPPLHRTH